MMLATISTLQHIMTSSTATVATTPTKSIERRPDASALCLADGLRPDRAEPAHSLRVCRVGGLSRRVECARMELE